MTPRPPHRALTPLALVLAAGLLAVTSISASDGPPPAGTAPENWVITSELQMVRRAPGRGVASTTCVGRTSRSEETLDFCTSTPTGGSHLEALFVEGAVVIVRGVTLTPANVTPALDAPLLGMRFVLELMRRAFPEGPRAVAARTSRTIRSANQSVTLYGDGESVTLTAPWTVEAEAWPSPSGGVDFNLRWKGSSQADPGGPNAEEVFGHLGPAQPLPPLEPAFGLKGWTAYRVLQGRPFILPGFATLADLRQALPWLPLELE